MIYWAFFIEICVKAYSVILFISEKCKPTSKKDIFLKYIKNSECTHIFQICKQERNMLFSPVTHGNKRAKMATCIVMYLKIVFVNT